MSIGNALKSLRSKANMTQSEFADYLRTPLGTYRNWEQDLRDPETRRLVEIAQLLNTSVDYLLGLEKDDAEFSDIQIAANNGFDLDDLSESDQEEIRNFIRFKRGQKNEPTDSSD